MFKTKKRYRVPLNTIHLSPYSYSNGKENHVLLESSREGNAYEKAQSEERNKNNQQNGIKPHSKWKRFWAAIWSW